jgi:hypothetical protein
MLDIAIQTAIGLALVAVCFFGLIFFTWLLCQVAVYLMVGNTMPIIDFRHRLSFRRRYVEGSLTILFWLLFIGFWTT